MVAVIDNDDGDDDDNDGGGDDDELPPNERAKLVGHAPSPRGCGVLWGGDVTHRWLASNGFQMMIRSHEVDPQSTTLNLNPQPDPVTHLTPLSLL